MIALVKEIKFLKGIFPLKSIKTGKFSASESYTEQFLQDKLPGEAPKDFLEARSNIYYINEKGNVINYLLLHKKISYLTKKIIDKGNDKKKAKLASSKKVMQAYLINSKSLLAFSPILTKMLAEGDERAKVTAKYDFDEKTIFVKTKLIKKEPEVKELTKEDEAEENAEKIAAMNDLIESINQDKSSEIEQQINEKKESKDTSKADIEALKNKYKFKKPEKKESMRDIINRTSGKKKTTKKKKEPEEKNEVFDPEKETKEIINETLFSISGNWQENKFVADYKKSGYLVSIKEIELTEEKIKIKSSNILNSEWWVHLMPNNQCPRFEGALNIKDSFQPSCIEANCSEACGAEDGFVELSAARFRFIEEKDIIAEKFKRLQEYLDRAYRLIEEFKTTFNVNIYLDINTTKPFLFAEIQRPADEFELRNYLEAFTTMYPEITDIRGKMDIEKFNINDNFDPVSEEGLLQEARNYSLQEMVRLASIDMLENIIKMKEGKIEDNYYLIDKGRFRFVLKPNAIQAIRDELYMGSVSFKKGANEVQQFLSITLGGGRW